MLREQTMVNKHRIDEVPSLGQVLTSGPLFRWLSEQESNHVTLSYAPSSAAGSSLGTQPLRQLKWQMVLFFDDNKRARFGWKLNSGGKLSDMEIIRYMEEAFDD